MRCLTLSKRSGALSLLALPMLLILIVMPAVSDAQSSSTSDDWATDKFGRFLVAAYNGLIDQGALSSRKVSSASEFWQTGPSVDLASALGAYFPAGGIVTTRALYQPDVNLSTWVDLNDDIRLTIPGEEVSPIIRHRIGLYDCELEPVAHDSLNAALLVVNNLECLFAKQVREAFLTNPPADGQLSWEFVQDAYVDQALRSYLESLSGQGILESFNVSISEQTIDLTFSPGLNSPSIPHVYLYLGKVNPYATAQEEAQATLNEVNEWLQTNLVFVDGETANTLYPVETVVQALQAGQESVSQGAYRAQTLKFMGYEPLLLATATPTPAEESALFQPAPLMMGQPEPTIPPEPTPVDPCTYPGSTVTPCTTQGAIFQSWDHNGFLDPDMYTGVQGVLRSLGYSLPVIDGRPKNIPRGSAFDEKKLAQLRKAQVLFMLTHSAGGGPMMQVYPDIDAYEPPKGDGKDGPSKECCEKLKSTAVSLGFIKADDKTMDCSVRRRPDTDPTGSVEITPEKVGRRDACGIKASKDLYRNLGTKAAVFAVQCFSGDFVNDAPMFGQVLDLVAHSKKLNYNAVIQCDDKRLAKDIRSPMYCYTQGLIGRESSWTSVGGKCPYVTQAIRPVPQWGLKTIASSLTTRGAWAPDKSLEKCDETKINKSGYFQYQTAVLGGDAGKEVEFAPQVRDAGYDPVSRTFSLSFSSVINPNGAKLLATPVQCRKRKVRGADYAPGGEPKVTETGGSFRLSNEWATMSPLTWNTNYADMKKRYGFTQFQWPYYIKVTLTGMTAPNGVQGFGNAGAAMKWLWTDNQLYRFDPPWRFTNGQIKEGGNIFEVRIPCDPPAICCMPNIDKRNCEDDQKQVKTYCQQNGCSITSTGKSDCFLDAKGMADYNCGIFKGTYHGPWDEPCNGADMNCDGQIYLPKGTPLERQNCADTPNLAIADQFKTWTVDTTVAQQCPSRGLCNVQPTPLPKCKDVVAKKTPTPGPSPMPTAGSNF